MTFPAPSQREQIEQALPSTTDIARIYREVFGAPRWDSTCFPDFARAIAIQALERQQAEHDAAIESLRAQLVAEKAEKERWSARLEWLAAQDWVQDEASWRLNLIDAATSAVFFHGLVSRIDAALSATQPQGDSK